MYAALYRWLPGNRLLELVLLLVLALAVLAVLFFFVFPMIETFIAEDPSVDGLRQEG